MSRQKAIILSVLCACLFTALKPYTAGAQGVAVRTNLLWDFAAAEPNLGLEWAPAEHWSLGVNAGFKPWMRYLVWDNDRTNPAQWRNLTVAPEFRFYPKAAFDGWFLGADLLYSHFNVGGLSFPFGVYKAVKENRLQGDLYGAGLFAGYSWWLDRHWRLEAEAGLGGGYYKAGKYECAHCGAKLDDVAGPAIVPKLGVNLAYNFTARKIKEEIIQIIQPAIDTLVPPVEVPEPEPLVWTLLMVPEWMGVAGELAPSHPVLRPSSEYKPYTPDRILRKEEGALYVFFPLDKSLLQRSFTEGNSQRDNGPVLDEIMDITRSILQDTTSSVSRIQIVGLASVEGPEKRNQRLSDERALAMQRYIQDRLPVPDDLFESVGGGEAWTELRDMVEDLIASGGGDGLSVAQLEEVRRIIDKENDPAKRERALRKLEGGKVYKSLLDHVFRELRNSGYIRIYFDYVPDRNALMINQAIDLMEAGKADEALQILDIIKDDARSRNARASALLRLGREDEAVAVLKEAAADGDAAAKENLREWERHQREVEAYEKYQEELKEYKQLTNSITTN